MQAVFYDAFLSAWAVFVRIMSLFHTEPHRAYRSAFVAVNRIKAPCGFSVSIRSAKQLFRCQTNQEERSLRAHF